jgi:hypothetical protein
VLLRGVFLTLAGVLAVAALLQGPLMAKPAEAAAQVGPLVFSTDMSDQYVAGGNVGIEFGGDNNGVFVTFNFKDLPPGSNLSRIVRFDGEDYNYDSDTFGHLNCCGSGGTGRYGFLIVKRAGARGELPGGAYDVRIYLNGNEVANGGFGIKGTGGSDHDNRNGNDNS